MRSLFLTFLFTLVPSVALAQTSPFDTAPEPVAPREPASSLPDRGSERWDRPFTLGGTVGLGGAPAGIVALAFEVTPSRFFTMETAAGLSTDGPQISAMPRLRLPAGPLGISFGTGLSTGKYTWSDKPIFDFCFLSCSGYAQKQWKRVVRANFELSIERRSERGFQARTFIGVGRVLNRNSFSCQSVGGYEFGLFEEGRETEAPPCDTEQGATIGYAGGSFGYAF